MKKLAMLLALVCLFTSCTPGFANEDTTPAYLFLDIPFGSPKDAVAQAIKNILGVHLEENGGILHFPIGKSTKFLGLDVTYEAWFGAAGLEKQRVYLIGPKDSFGYRDIPAETPWDDPLIDQVVQDIAMPIAKINEVYGPATDGTLNVQEDLNGKMDAQYDFPLLDNNIDPTVLRRLVLSHKRFELNLYFENIGVMVSGTYDDASVVHGTCVLMVVTFADKAETSPTPFQGGHGSYA